MTPLKKRVSDPLELNVIFCKTGQDLKQGSLKSTARHYRRIVQKKKKKKKKKGKALSTAAPNKGEIDTSKSDSEADCGASYKKSSTQRAPEAGEEYAGRTLGGRRGGRVRSRFSRQSRALTGDANVTQGT